MKSWKILSIKCKGIFTGSDRKVMFVALKKQSEFHFQLKKFKLFIDDKYHKSLSNLILQKTGTKKLK